MTPEVSLTTNVGCMTEEKAEKWFNDVVLPVHCFLMNMKKLTATPNERRDNAYTRHHSSCPGHIVAPRYHHFLHDKRVHSHSSGDCHYSRLAESYSRTKSFWGQRLSQQKQFTLQRSDHKKVLTNQGGFS